MMADPVSLSILKKSQNLGLVAHDLIHRSSPAAGMVSLLGVPFTKDS